MIKRSEMKLSEEVHTLLLLLMDPFQLEYLFIFNEREGEKREGRGEGGGRRRRREEEGGRRSETGKDREVNEVVRNLRIPLRRCIHLQRF